MRPYDCKTNKQVCAQRSDNTSAGDFWILTDGCEVSLAAQKVGEPASEMISIPRAQFNKLIDWYMRDQKKSAKAA